MHPKPATEGWPLRWLRLALISLASWTGATAQTPTPTSPDEAWGPLFADVQRSRCFPDQKTFADAVPRTSIPSILEEYERAQRAGDDSFNVCDFVQTHFLLPEVQDLAVEPNASLIEHLHNLWPRLRRAPDQAVAGSSLLPLPHPYVVPGGRFREVYYWDTYFTMLGLRESGETELIESMVANFAYLLETFGHIPNGNRAYYLTRSQPPFFALMVELLAEIRGPEVYVRYLPALRREEAFWNDRTAPTQHRVRLPDGEILQRYYDMGDRPRAEAFVHDEEVAARADRSAGKVYRDLRSACESGWDFSSRWFRDGRNLASIQTLDLVPVDLNCLLFALEQTLQRACRASGEMDSAEEFGRAAAARRAAILKYCWSAEDGFFCDYNIRTQQRSADRTLAGVFPLFVGLAEPAQAEAVRDVIERDFLKAGGVVTTLKNTGQQWDAPNGWAPLQWTTIHGLRRYGHRQLAGEISRRWLELNRTVFERTGKMMEKYNVENLELEAGGGEYPGQDGFGWSNGVYLALSRGETEQTSTPPSVDRR